MACRGRHVYCTACTVASLYRKKRSPFWYLQFVNAEGKRQNISTGLRWDDERQTSEAREYRAKMEAKELRLGRISSGKSSGWDFVPAFLENRDVSETTKIRYRKTWHWVNLWLVREKINHPSEVKFHHAQDYLDWRKTHRKKTGKVVCHNTALLETKVFSMIVNRAVQLERCRFNPLVKLGIGYEDVDEKPEITAAELEIILPALEKEPEWMRISFLIALHTGCRLRETILPLRWIDFDRGTIHFSTPKGGKKRAFSVPMPPQLRPVLEPLRGRTVTLEMPFQPSRQWQHFFRRVEMEHLCFHCTRVTFITGLARRGVPLSVAMRLVNHASATIHRIYQRVNVDDLRAYATGHSWPGVDATAHTPGAE